MDLVISPLGRTLDGRAIERYVLRNDAGLSADIMTYGATLMAMRAPDRDGRFASIVLGFDTLEPYLAGTPYFGATIGRYANRIARARFELDGTAHTLAANDGRNHLHGGAIGFDKVVWNATPLSDGVKLSYVSADGEEGYPGELSVDVAFRLTGDNRLIIDYRATTTKPTHVNLTHHSYFNLSGDASREITGHELTIDADRYLPIDAELIPTGDFDDVAGTPFDFRSAHMIGARIDADNVQLRMGGGYDHTFVLNKHTPGALARAAKVSDPQSGRAMEVWTSEPGVQFYSGNTLAARCTGFCLEPQHFPNSPNEPRFPSTILRSEREYSSRTEFRFDVL